MTNFDLTQALVQDRHQALHATAGRQPLWHPVRRGRRRPVRLRAGWFLIRTGLRLTDASSVRPKVRSVRCSPS
jgi:hypothetical protein